jgi:hypothetical protein
MITSTTMMSVPIYEEVTAAASVVWRSLYYAL